MVSWALLIGGCGDSESSTKSVREQLATADAKPAAASPSAEPTSQPTANVHPIALVNGAPVSRRELMQILVESHGLTVLQQLVLRELAAQECRRLGLSIKQADIDHEYDLTLLADRFDGKDPDKLTPARREQLIHDWTKSRSVSRAELAVALHRQALLRRICSDKVIITDAMLHEEFHREHGEKVEVRHLQIAAPRSYPQIRERLDKGEDFAKLVREYSQNASSREKNGLLAPFSANDPDFPAEFTAAAFKLKPGEVSNLIQARNNYHLLKLERRIPADAAAFDDVKDSLTHHLRARLVAQKMEHLGAELLMKSSLNIEDKTLSDQYRSMLSDGEITGPPLTNPGP